MNKFQLLSVAVLPLIFAITAHEAAHGWVANKLGDPTAKQMGRLTFNPLPHIDPIGTILVPMVMLFLGGFIFGWAKPVPVNTQNFAEPRKHMAIVALAGPGSNLAMALLWGLVWKMGYLLPLSIEWLAVQFILMAQVGVFLNLVLMVLNLLPIPPLDGSRVLTWVLPPTLAAKVDQVEPYGIFILLGLLYVGLWGSVISPATGFISNLIQHLFSLGG